MCFAILCVCLLPKQSFKSGHYCYGLYGSILKKNYFPLAFLVHVKSFFCVCLFSDCENRMCVHASVGTCAFSTQVLIYVIFICVVFLFPSIFVSSSLLSPPFCHPHPPCHHLLPWLQGSPGFCAPGSTPPPNPQRPGEHSPSQGHAHHHQVKATKAHSFH